MVKKGGYIMNILKVIKDNSEYFLALVALLPNIMGFIFKQLSAYFDKTRAEKILKRSEMGEIFEERISLSLIQLSCYIPVYLVLSLMVILLCYFFKLKEPNVYIQFPVFYIVYLILSELTVKKLRENYKKFVNNLINDKIKLKNKFLFYCPSIIMNLIIFFTVIFKTKNNLFINVMFVLVVIIIFSYLLKYFSAMVTFNRYLFVKIYFNNSFPMACIDYKDYSIKETSYITVKSSINNYTKLTKYNNNIIVKIEYLGNKKVDDDYTEHLLKRGFIR